MSGIGSSSSRIDAYALGRRGQQVARADGLPPTWVGFASIPRVRCVGGAVAAADAELGPQLGDVHARGEVGTTEGAGRAVVALCLDLNRAAGVELERGLGPELGLDVEAEIDARGVHGVADVKDLGAAGEGGLVPLPVEVGARGECNGPHLCSLVLLVVLGIAQAVGIPPISANSSFFTDPWERFADVVWPQVLCAIWFWIDQMMLPAIDKGAPPRVALACCVNYPSRKFSTAETTNFLCLCLMG